MNTIIRTQPTHAPVKPFHLAFIAAGSLLIITAGALSSCATSKGFGRDVERLGDNIQEAAS